MCRALLLSAAIACVASGAKANPTLLFLMSDDRRLIIIEARIQYNQRLSATTDTKVISYNDARRILSTRIRHCLFVPHNDYAYRVPQLVAFRLADSWARGARTPVPRGNGERNPFITERSLSAFR